MKAARKWVSVNGKWSVEVLGNIEATKEEGTYSVEVTDKLEGTRTAKVMVTKKDEYTTRYVVEVEGAKIPQYVLKQIESMIWNARWVGLEPAAVEEPVAVVEEVVYDEEEKELAVGVFPGPELDMKLDEIIKDLEPGDKVEIAPYITLSVCTRGPFKTFEVKYKSPAWHNWRYTSHHRFILKHAYDAVMRYQKPQAPPGEGIVAPAGGRWYKNA